ncbi:MAG: DNAase [Idiomarina sp.]|nr:MAG: DNAase [Idiomarina sp.]
MKGGVVKLFDSHCHINFDAFQQDREAVMQRAAQQGVKRLFVPGVTRQLSSDKRWIDDCLPIEIIEGYGLHPYFIEEHQASDLDWLARQLDSAPGAVVGEIGLDANMSDYKKQYELFSAQVDLAVTFKRRVVLHHRKTQPELLRILKPVRDKLPEVPGVIHAFSGSAEQANEWINLGFMLGVGGTITYSRANKTRQAIQQANIHHLVLETDAPDMPLKGFQGQRNEPAHCFRVLEQLSELRDEPIEQLAKVIWNNTCRLFGASIR